PAAHVPAHPDARGRVVAQAVGARDVALARLARHSGRDLIRPAEAPGLGRDVRAGQAEVAPGLGPELQLGGRPPLRFQLARRHVAGRGAAARHLIVRHARVHLKGRTDGLYDTDARVL